MTCSAGAFPVPDFCLIFVPFKGYDEPEILRSQLSQFGPIRADARQMTHGMDAIGRHEGGTYTHDLHGSYVLNDHRQRRRGRKRSARRRHVRSPQSRN